MSKTNEIATRDEQIRLSNPRDIMRFATNLKKLIVQNELFTPIKGKNYVNVEGWQIAGAFTGTFPIVEVVENLSQGSHYKYRAEVSLRDKDGNKVGYGVAICTNQEQGKKNFDEYAVASMAQTRAVGKAYRMKIGWLLKVAGYETTPAEEMDAVKEAEVVKKEPAEPKPSVRDISYAKDTLAQARNLKELRTIFSMMSKELQNLPEIIDYATQLKEKISEEDNGEKQ